MKSNYEKYVVELILKIARSIFKTMNHIAQQPQLHPELIASGLVWQAIRHSFFEIKEYFDFSKGIFHAHRPGRNQKSLKEHQNKTLKKILDDST